MGNFMIKEVEKRDDFVGTSRAAIPSFCAVLDFAVDELHNL